MSTWPRQLGWAGWALDLWASKASGSLPERWLLLLSLMPLKSPLARFLPGFGALKPSPGPDGGGGGSPCPSIRSREAWHAQACSRVPSIEKCSSLSSALTCGAPISFSKKRPMTCSFSKGSSEKPSNDQWSPDAAMDLSWLQRRNCGCSELPKRSRFFVDVVGCQIGSSGHSPTNQRYSRL